MKKIAFALQVFALITMLPLYVIIELNHSTAAPTKNKIVTEVNGNEKIIPTVYHQVQGYNEHLLSRATDKRTLLPETLSLTTKAI